MKILSIGEEGEDLATSLRLEGFTVYSTDNRMQATRLVHQLMPDLVILDISLPQMHGWEECRRIREVSRVPILIICNCAGNVRDEVQALNAGADDYLIKPVEFCRLLAHIMSLLRRTQKQNEPCTTKTYIDSHLIIDLRQQE